MRKFLPLLLLFTGICFSTTAQISVTTTNTASICYNDGTLTIHASGGTAPFKDSILSGPANPNLVYPITLPAGQSTFTDLPHGTFTIVVHDAAGHSTTITASVGGTYQFLSDSLYQNSYFGGNTHTDTLFCRVNSGTGLPPYQYAISSVGANSGFGAYQNSNLFTGLCPGQYWVRVRDSCGNIFTNNINYSYNTLYGRQNCSSISSGIVSLSAFGGNAPYTYIIECGLTNSDSNHTGYFTGIPSNGSCTWKIKDGCGVIYNSYMPVAPPNATFSASCPFSGSLTIPSYSGTFPTLPFSVSCLNCSPVQRDTFTSYPYNSQPVFTGLQGGHTYYLQVADACGNTVVDTFTVAPAININSAYVSCRSVRFTCSYTNGQPIPPADIDSFIFTYNGSHYTSRNGYFFDLPPTTNSNGDYVQAFTTTGCQGRINFPLTLPDFNLDFTPQKGPNCDPVWNGVDFDTLPERYYLITTANDTIKEQPIQGGYGLRGFYFVPPNNSYTLVSDSGCSISIHSPAVPKTSDSVVSYVSCLGVPTIYESCWDSVFPNNFGINGIQFFTTWGGYYVTKFFLHGSLVLRSDTVPYNTTGLYGNPGYFVGSYTHALTDTGLYTYKTYFIKGVHFGAPYPYLNDAFYMNSMYDTICPQDSGTIYVTNRTEPFPYVATAYKCNGISASPPLLTIYGGSIPYTVQVPGIDTFTMNANTAVFPTDSVGSYTVIAYDNCGISRSFTFTIYDSCSACGTISANNDTFICAGQSVTLTAHAQRTGGTYSWAPGGGNTQSISVTPAATTVYSVTYTKGSCPPQTDSVTVSVGQQPTSVVSVSYIQTQYTFTDSVTSGQGPFTYSWTFGDGATATGSTVTHNFSGDFGGYVVTVIVSSPCGNDTVKKLVKPLGEDNITDLAAHVSVYPNPNTGSFTVTINAPGTAPLTAEVTDITGRSLSSRAVVYGENRFDLNLSAGVYMVKVTDGSSRAVKLITVK